MKKQMRNVAGCLALAVAMPSMMYTGTAALLLSFGQVTLAQDAAPTPSAGKHFDLKQPGTQILNLARIATESQKGGRIVATIKLEQGELAGTLVLRMLSRDGVDLAPQALRMGFNDPTREFPIAGLKPGSSVQISENFTSGSGAAWVEVELKADVKRAPCSLSVEGLAIKEPSATIAQEKAEAAGTLIDQPEKGFRYAQNLLPPLDRIDGNSGWKSSGSATTGNAMAGQSALILPEKGEGKWESPIAPLAGNTKELNLQAFVKFDAIATPREHPFDLIFRDAKGNVLPGKSPRRWTWSTWGHFYGQWIPLNTKFDVPQQAASVQVVLAMRELQTPPWQTGAAKVRNNFGTFQVAGLRLWGSPAQASGSSDWSGNVASPGPFTPCASAQQNSVILTTHVHSSGNLSFGARDKWPAPKMWVENFLPIRRSIILKGEVFDWAGKKIQTVSWPVELAPYQKKDVEIPIDHPERSGTYSANIDAQQDGILVGQSVIRWGYFPEASDRADRHNDQYPFFFHPGIMADDNGMKDPARLTDEIRVLRALGVRGIRLQFRLWSFDVAKPDYGIAQLQKLGDNYRAQVEPFLRRGDLESYISFFPKPSSPVPTSPEDLAKWREFMAAAVKQFPLIKTFVFGNEEVGSAHVNLDVRPLIWGYRGSLREYFVQFLEARKAALAARPDILFMIGEATDPQAHVARLYFEDGHSPKDLQGWATNSYNTPGPNWAKLSDVLKKNGADVSSMTGILPEIGYNFPPRGPNRLNGEKYHAMAVLRTHLDVLTAAPWVKYITFFATVHAGVENHGVFDADYSPKPAAGAYLCMTSTLGAGRPNRVTELPGTTAYLWQRPDASKVGILWGTGRKQARVRVGTDAPVIVRDLMGNDTSVQPRSGVIDVQITDAPIYLLNINTLTDGSDLAVDWTLERTDDNGRQIKAVIRNRTDKTLDIDGTFEAPADIKWSDPAITGIRLAPGESQTITRSFTSESQGFSDWTTLSLKLNASGNANASGFSTSLFTARKAKETPSDDADDALWKSADVALIQDLRQETHNVGPIRWSGPDDLSARCSVLWDEKNFYFRAQVKDDVLVQQTAPEKMWSNDSIQIGIRPAADSIGPELTLGMADGKPSIYKNENKERLALSPDVAKMKVTRNESTKTTTYVAAIAWSAVNISQVKAGDHFRFGIVVNDSDHPGSGTEDRQGMQWFSGIFQKDATKWGDLTLCQ